MNKVLTWNVKGLNILNKQNVVRSLIHNHYVGLVSILETRVKINNMGNLYLNYVQVDVLPPTLSIIKVAK